MFRSNKEMDMSDEEFERISMPHNEMFDAFMIEYIIPEASAFYLATGYNTDSVWEASFNTHINTMLSMLNYQASDDEMSSIKENVRKILKIKYGFLISNEDPLDFKKNY